MKNHYFLLTVIILSLSSCASYTDLNQSLKFEEDDIYYTNDFQHRLNKRALLMNDNVAMPDSTWEYFDESYANSIRPSYAKQFDKFESTDTSTQYMEDNEKEYDYAQANCNNGNNNWINGVGVGVGASAYYGYNAYYNGYQLSYYRSNNYYNTSYVNQRNQVSAPKNYEPNLNRYTSGANSRIVTPVKNNRTVKPYINSNPGYDSNNSDRQYRTRTSNSQSGGYQSPYNSSRSGGGSAPSGKVSGYQRR